MINDIRIEEQPLIDLEKAIGKEKAHNFLLRFIDEFQIKSLEIENALKASDFTQLQHLTHTYASSSATFGAISLYDICRKIEDACAQGHTQNLQHEVDSLKEVGLHSCEELKNHY